MASCPQYSSGCAKRKLKAQEELTKKVAGSLERFMKPKVLVISNTSTFDNVDISKW